MKSLAIKYRPKVFSDVVEQDTIKTILQQQLATNTIKHAYLFCGPAGDGKTTTARIFANEINKGQGNPIEMDAASHNGVDDVRDIIQQAQTKSIDSEYKVFIIDECHSISSTGWQAMLKLIEEPPAKSIFIFCTTDPQKIPKTILSRVQRYDFSRISTRGIIKRLEQVIDLENDEMCDNCGNDFEPGEYERNCLEVTSEAIDFIAKLAEGGMRTALSYLDKCISYTNKITVDTVIEALGTTNYDDMFDLLRYIQTKRTDGIIGLIEELYNNGKDLKQFIKQFMLFVLDVNKYKIIKEFDFIQIPNMYGDRLETVTEDNKLLSTLVKLISDIKWETSPKALIEATLLLEVSE